MWRVRVLAVVVSGILVDSAAAQAPILIGFVEGDTKFAVQRAAEGASARLARPGCQEIFDDFADAAGAPLSTVLAAKGKSPAEAFGGLRFFDDGTAPQCRAGDILAFTQAGTPVVRICSLQFRERFARDRTATEIILIHEFLHALGLGEKPPTSREITSRVSERCSGRRTSQIAPQVRWD
jgi:hypothetical protein